MSEPSVESVEGGSGGGPMGLEALIALNDELAALSRAGLPLERALLGSARDLPGRLGRVVAGLGRRMSGGQSLPEALEAEGPGLPATYRAVVEAGLRSGRLSTALEGLATYARNYAELRRAVGLAFLYPTLVLLLAYALFIGFVLELVPRINAAFGALGVPEDRAGREIEGLGATVWAWGPIVPGLVAVGVAAWVATGRARALRPGRIDAAMRWVPWMRGILANWRAANFAEWLALMVEHRVPLPEAVALAASATGDPALVAAGGSLAEAARRGEPLAGAADRAALPGLLRWLIVSGERQGRLPEALRFAAATYRRRALHGAEGVRAVLPTALLILVGLTATLLYALTLFVPWSALLEALGRP